MIRWSYVLPRCLLAVVVAAAVHFTAPLAIRWALTGLVRGATGADVQMARARAWLTRGAVRVDGIQLAQRRSSKTNLVTVEAARLAIDLSALAHRQVVVEAAELHGLRFYTPRHPAPTASTPLEPPSVEPVPLPPLCSDTARRWLDSLADGLQRRVENEFAAVRLARQLTQRWPTEYERLSVEVSHCREKAQQLVELLRKADRWRGNASELRELESLWQQVVDLQHQIRALHARVAAVADRVELDRQAIAQAVAEDRQQLRDKARLLELDGQALNDSLLRGRLTDWYSQVRAWCQALQWLAAQPAVEPARTRGQTIVFANQATGPDLLVHAAQIDGHLQLRDQELAFAGQLTNLAVGGTPPASPTTIRLAIRAPTPATIAIALDRVDGRPRQRLRIRARNIPLSALEWGRSDTLTATLRPGSANLDCQLVVVGNELAGRLVISVTDIHWQLAVAPKYADHQLPQMLARATRDLTSFEATAQLAGTTAAPRWSIQSNLGPSLEQHLQQAAQQAVDLHAEQLADTAEQLISARLAERKQELTTRQSALVQQLEEGRKLLASLPSATVAIRPVWQLLK